MARRRTRRKGKKYTDLEKLAFNMGKIQRGLNNDNSRVYASYNNGLKNVRTSKRKPLL